MTMWIIIMWSVIALFAAAFTYIGIRIPQFFPMQTIAEWPKAKCFFVSFMATLGLTGIISLCLDFINAIVCVLYVAMILGLCDFIFWLMQKFTGVTFDYYYAGIVAVVISILALGTGWYLNHGVWQTNYRLTTDKNMSQLKIAMFADAHIGTTFDDKGFAKHLSVIQKQNPDLVVVVGDYVDDETTKEEMINATRALGKMKTKYGIYFVLGNHDKGYYGAAHRGFSLHDLIGELKNNGIIVLQDDAVLVDNDFYVIGRKDFSIRREQKGKRMSMKELTATLDKDKYMIVLDHQPADFAEESKAKVDLVLCGHTHGGQLFPFNQVGRWIKANDLIYGHERRNKTDFIVTSGISSWAIKFKTGTKSEFVMIEIKSNGRSKGK